MTESIHSGYWLDLGARPYEPAFRIQEQLIQARLDGRWPTTVIVQENDPVFTIGRTGSRGNVLAPDEALQKRGIEILFVNRGGDVTYHGPGQIIVSPLFYLGDLDMNANQYFHRLEDVLIDVLAAYGIEAGKKEGYPGAWCGEYKIAQLGIAVKHGYCFHGFALNVNLDLAPFELINPCGVARMPVTSMQKMLGREIAPDAIRQTIRDILARTFHFQFEDLHPDELEDRLPPEVPLAQTA